MEAGKQMNDNVVKHSCNNLKYFFIRQITMLNINKYIFNFSYNYIIVYYKPFAEYLYYWIFIVFLSGALYDSFY